MWKLVPALTIQHIMPCMKSTEPLEIYMVPGLMEEEVLPDPRPLPLVSKLRSWGSRDLCWDQCRIGLPPEDTQLSTRNAWLWSQETRPHWRSKSGYVQWVSWSTRITWRSLHWWLQNERVGAAAVINRHFQKGETTCRQLFKRLPDNSTIFAAEATAISLALNYYQHMGPVHHDVVV